MKMQPSTVFGIGGLVALAVALGVLRPHVAGAPRDDFAATCRTAVAAHMTPSEADALCGCVAKSHAALSAPEMGALIASYRAAAAGHDAQAAAQATGLLAADEVGALLDYDFEVVSTCAGEEQVSPAHEMALLREKL